MIYCLDVDYQVAGVTAAGVGFTDWGDARARVELVSHRAGAAVDYAPGRFFERELPYLTELLDRASDVAMIVVDGYVWLGADRPGLGAHLHAARGVPVIGVAKSRFAGAAAVEVVRGTSRRPLLVTAVGIEAALAAEHVRTMHGEFRIPTLVKRADALARRHVAPLPAMITP